RGFHVTGVQTCALPISAARGCPAGLVSARLSPDRRGLRYPAQTLAGRVAPCDSTPERAAGRLVRPGAESCSVQVVQPGIKKRFPPACPDVWTGDVSLINARLGSNEGIP